MRKHAAKLGYPSRHLSPSVYAYYGPKLLCSNLDPILAVTRSSPAVNETRHENVQIGYRLPLPWYPKCVFSGILCLRDKICQNNGKRVCAITSKLNNEILTEEDAYALNVRFH